MVRVLIILSLIFGGIVAMAKDGNIQVPPKSREVATGMKDDRERYRDELWARYEAGEIDLEQSMDLYDARFGAPDLSPKTPAPPANPNQNLKDW